MLQLSGLPQGQTPIFLMPAEISRSNRCTRNDMAHAGYDEVPICAVLPFVLHCGCGLTQAPVQDAEIVGAARIAGISCKSGIVCALMLAPLPLCTQAGSWQSLGPTSTPRQPGLHFDLRRSAAPAAGAQLACGPPSRSGQQQQQASDGGRDDACDTAGPQSESGQAHGAHVHCTVSQTVSIPADRVSLPPGTAVVSSDGKPGQGLQPGEAPLIYGPHLMPEPRCL